MNLSEIHKLSNNEIVENMARMIDSPMEKAMKAELDLRLIKSVNDLTSTVYTLRLSLDNLAKSNKTAKKWLMFISLLLITIIGIAVYCFIQLNFKLIGLKA
jgi:hypothetical protein